MRVQSLCIARDWIQSWITQKVFNPGFYPGDFEEISQ